MTNNHKTTISRDIVYPPVGIAHITKNIADLVGYNIQDKKKVHIHCAAQPNGHPHLGTVTTLMTSFAIAKHMALYYGISPEVRFEEIDNSPAEKVTIDGITYSKNVRQMRGKDEKKDVGYMDTFKILFDFLVKQTEIPYRIRPFSEYQKDPFVRGILKRLLDNEEVLAPILSPSEKRLHIRIQCPICGLVEKAGINLKKERLPNGDYRLTSNCYKHGPFEAILSEASKEYIDTNTPITDVIQGALFIEEDKKESALSIMVDGNDWSGVWALNIFCRGLVMLGYEYLEIPLHFYAPLITDWSGAKFSKSLHVNTDTYKYLPEELVNFDRFIETWGEKGLDILWQEVCSWVEDPKKLFRDYSIDYFEKILEEKLT